MILSGFAFLQNDCAPPSRTGRCLTHLYGTHCARPHHHLGQSYLGASARCKSPCLLKGRFLNAMVSLKDALNSAFNHSREAKPRISNLIKPMDSGDERFGLRSWCLTNSTTIDKWHPLTQTLTNNHTTSMSAGRTCLAVKRFNVCLDVWILLQKVLQCF